MEPSTANLKFVEMAHRHYLDVVAQETYLSKDRRLTLEGYETQKDRRKREEGTAVLVVLVKKRLKH